MNMQLNFDTGVDVATLPAELPDIATARLPAVYESAKQALASCADIDECKEWGDKAAAMASYAKQANDETLFNFATRIKARAIRRCGELLRQYDARPQNAAKQMAATVPLISRADAGANAGLSERQVKTAVRVANVPAQEFEAAIESSNPPTIESLAERGTNKRPAPAPAVDLGERTPEEFAAATKLIGAMDQFERQASPIDISIAAKGLSGEERSKLVGQITGAKDWLTRLQKELSK